MMTKVIRAKELHYPMIQFLMIIIIVFFWERGVGGGDPTGTCRVTCQVWMKDVDVYSDAFQVFVLSEVEKLSFILNLYNVALVILTMLIFFSYETLISQKMRRGL